MATLQALLSRVDLLLGEPPTASPSVPVRWEAMQQALQLVMNYAVNSPVSWALASTNLTTNQSIETYTLNVTDFGKDVLVETIDRADPNHVPRQIARMSWQSLSTSQFNAVSDDAFWDGTGHDVNAMAFSRQGSRVVVRVWPLPTNTATYRIWYETTGTGSDSLQNSLFTPLAESYATTQAAMILLPHCKWAGLDAKGNSEKRKEVGMILAPMLAELRLEWRRFLSTDRNAGRVVLVGFDDANYAEDRN